MRNWTLVFIIDHRLVTGQTENIIATPKETVSENFRIDIAHAIAIVWCGRYTLVQYAGGSNTRLNNELLLLLSVCDMW